MLIRRVRFAGSPEVHDVRIEGGVIVAIDPAEVAGVSAGSTGAGDDIALVEGDGGVLVPGLHDGHVHLTQWAIARRRVDLSATTSAADVVAVMTAAQAARPAEERAELLSGFGFRDALWSEIPAAAHWDAALPGVPVAAISQDLHSIWLSPSALDLVGFAGHPTGLLKEDDCFRAVASLPQPSQRTLDGWALEALHAAAARGVTRIRDFEFVDTHHEWTRRAALAPEGLPVRVEAAIFRPLLEDALAAGQRTGDPLPGTDGLVTVGPCKVLIDGSLNSRTALCHDAYPGTTDHGMLTQDVAELTATIRIAAAQGISFAVHAIGDRANTLALDCFQQAGVGGRIEHAQLVEPADRGRFAALGVTAGVQPAHAVEDRDVADVQWAGRTADAFAYRALVDAGAVLELGSDAPVSALDPWRAISAAVTRTDAGRPAWHGEQALTAAQALAASTGGRLRPEVGDVGDVVLVTHDPLAIDPAGLASMQVVLTCVGGRITHRAS
ncbi:MAG: amidohydrolase family protein [Nakamurella sp.]